MKKPLTILLIASAICTLLGGCQPTPESHVVTGKNDGQLYEKIADGYDVVGIYQGPEHYEDTITGSDGKVTIAVDADISIPALTQYPVYEMSAYEFNDAELNRIIECFKDGGRLVEQGAEYAVTKGEIEQAIMEKQQYMVLKKEELESGEISQDTYLQLIQAAEQDIADLGRQYQSAPDVDIVKEAAATLTESSPGIYSLTGIVERPDGRLGYLSIIKTMEGGFCSQSIHYMVNAAQNQWLKLKTLPEHLDGLGISRKEAVEAAQSYLGNLGIKEIHPSFIVAAYTNNTGASSQGGANEKCFGIYFALHYDGIPFTYASADFPSGFDPAQEKDYIMPIMPYSIFVAVGDGGIYEVNILNPITLNMMLSSNVELLPFDEVMGIFAQNAIHKVLFTGIDSGLVGRTLHISEIKLGYAQVRIKDSPSKMMAIPVWDFFGYEVNRYDSQTVDFALDANNERTDGLTPHSFLTINAIDGSIVERWRGY